MASEREGVLRGFSSRWREARTRDRIDALIEGADYPDWASALDDAWRTAVLACFPGLLRQRNAERQRAVGRANNQRRPGTRKGRAPRRSDVLLYLVAFLLGAVAIGLIALHPRGGGPALQLQDGALISGVLAVLSVALMWWLEPVRAGFSVGGLEVPARSHLFFALLWLGFATSVVVFRWPELDRHDLVVPLVGLLLMVSAGVAAGVLWRRAVKADRARPFYGVASLTHDLIDQADAPAVLDELDGWWARTVPPVLAANQQQVEQARVVVISAVGAMMLIPDREVRDALRKPPPKSWQERRR